MPCIAAPHVALPALPSPFTIAPTLPPVPPLAAGICCVNVSLPAIPLPPLPSGTVNIAFIQSLTAGVAAINTFLDQLVIDCPKNA